MEIMVTIVILGGIGVVATSSLFSLLRGASKTEYLKEVKQNGDYALSVMEIKIRNAQDIASVCLGVPATNIIIVNQDGNRTQTEFTCDNGSIMVRDVGALLPSPSPQVAYLTNNSVKLTACDTTNISFNCTQSSVTGLKSVMVKFTISQTTALPAAESTSQTFQTQVTLRNK